MNLAESSNFVQPMEEELIELVREHEVLYNTALRNYKDVGIREEAWEEVAKELNTTDNQQTRAKNTLCELASRIKGLYMETEAMARPQQSIQSSSLPPSTEADDQDEFEKYLDEQERSKRQRFNLEKSSERGNSSKLEDFKLDFFRALNEVEKFDRSSALEVNDTIKKYPEIVQNAALLVTALLACFLPFE